MPREAGPGEGCVHQPERSLVRPAVGDVPGPQAEDRAVVPQGDLQLVDLLPGVGDGQEVLVAVLDPLHRPADPAGGEGHQEVLGVEVGLDPEAAADVGRDDPDRARRDGEHPRQDGAHRVRPLGGGPDRHLAGDGVAVPDHAAGLHRDAGVALHVQPLADDPIRAGEGGLDVAALVDHRRRHVVGGVLVQHGRAGLDGGVGVDHRLKGLVVDLDELEGVLGEVPALGDDDRYALADVADGVGGQRVLRRRAEGVRGVEEGDARRVCAERRRRRTRRGRPAARRAARTSTDRIRACACGLRSTAMCSRPGKRMSSTKAASPRSSRGSSMRRTLAPTIFTPMSALPRLVGGLDRAHDPLVAGAPAEVARRAPPGSPVRSPRASRGGSRRW